MSRIFLSSLPGVSFPGTFGTRAVAWVGEDGGPRVTRQALADLTDTTPVFRGDDDDCFVTGEAGPGSTPGRFSPREHAIVSLAGLVRSKRLTARGAALVAQDMVAAARDDPKNEAKIVLGLLAMIGDH